MEYGNDRKCVGGAAVAGGVAGLLTVVAGAVGYTAEGRWPAVRPAALLAGLFLIPFLGLTLVVGLTACFRVRVRRNKIQHVLLGRFVLRERPLNRFLWVEVRGSPQLVFEGGRRMRLLGMHPDELNRMASDLSAFSAAARQLGDCGLPPRPVPLDPSWRTADVLSLAQAAYDNRALPAGTLEPARLALLADALEDAGCTDAEILGHLRGPGPHVRGCWAVDLVGGRE